MSYLQPNSLRCHFQNFNIFFWNNELFFLLLGDHYLRVFQRQQNTLVGIPEAGAVGGGKTAAENLRHQTVYGVELNGSAKKEGQNDEGGGGAGDAGGKTVAERIEYLKNNHEEKYNKLLRQAFVSIPFISGDRLCFYSVMFKRLCLKAPSYLLIEPLLTWRI